MTARASLPPSFDRRPFTTAVARELGVSENRLRASDLDARFHGIRMPAAPATLESLCRARSLLFPPDAFISGVTAAVLRLVPLPRYVEESLIIEVTVPEGRRALTGRGLRGRACRVQPGDAVDWRGLRLSSAPRLWCELGATLPLPDLVAAGDYLVNRDLPHTSIASLAEAVEGYPGRRGRGRLLDALPLVDDNSASRGESHLRVLVLQHGFSGFRTNMRIGTSSGFTYYGDLVLVRERVILEYQGAYHFDLAQQKKDMTRRSRLEADNWAVMLINSDDLSNPRELAARIREVVRLHSRQLVGELTR